MGVASGNKVSAGTFRITGYQLKQQILPSQNLGLFSQNGHLYFNCHGFDCFIPLGIWKVRITVLLCYLLFFTKWLRNLLAGLFSDKEKETIAHPCT